MNEVQAKRIENRIQVKQGEQKRRHKLKICLYERADLRNYKNYRRQT